MWFILTARPGLRAPNDTDNERKKTRAGDGDGRVCMSRHVLTTVAVAVLSLSALSAPVHAQEPSAAQELADLRAKAEAGDTSAQFTLGRMYAIGEGVPQDAAEAVRWFRLAAEQSYAPAQYILGFIHDTGEGVPEDAAEAVRWFRLAAEQGIARAQFNLGDMYANGKGVPQDNVEAHM